MKRVLKWIFFMFIAVVGSLELIQIHTHLDVFSYLAIMYNHKLLYHVFCCILSY